MMRHSNALASLAVALQLPMASRAAEPQQVNFQVRPEGEGAVRVFIDGDLAQQNNLHFFGLNKTSNQWVLVRDSFVEGTVTIYEFKVDGAQAYSKYTLAAALPKPPNSFELVRTRTPGLLELRYNDVDPGTTIETVTFDGQPGRVIHAVPEGGSGAIPVLATDVARGYCLNTAPKVVVFGERIAAIGVRQGDEVQVTSGQITEAPNWKTVYVGDGKNTTFQIEHNPNETSVFARIKSQK